MKLETPFIMVGGMTLNDWEPQVNNPKSMANPPKANPTGEPMAKTIRIDRNKRTVNRPILTISSPVR